VDVYSEERPWGSFERFNENERCTVKLLHIKPFSRLSLQYHTKRREFWKVINGSATVQVDTLTTVLSEGDTITVHPKSKHRIEAASSGCVVLEISYGPFDENDIVRLDDDYKRV